MYIYIYISVCICTRNYALAIASASCTTGILLQNSIVDHIAKSYHEVILRSCTAQLYHGLRLGNHIMESDY